MGMRCGACDADNRDGARFCKNCGKSLNFAPPPPGWQQEAVVTKPESSIPRVPPGTVVLEDKKTPGTVLQSQRDQLPVCGWLVILRGRRKGRDFRIEKDVSVLGRDGTCDYIIEDDLVSRQHVRLRNDAGKYTIHDLGSGNGTFLNGKAISKSPLEDGDVFQVGDSYILFKEAKPRVPLQAADGGGGLST